MVTVAQRRAAVDHLTDRRYSQRRACRLVGLPRSVAWYRLKGRDDAQLRDRLKVLAERYPRYGYLTLHEMLKREGRVINRKRTYRLYREEGLQVRTKRRKKLTRPRVPMPVPTQANERWSASERYPMVRRQSRYGRALVSGGDAVMLPTAKIPSNPRERPVSSAMRTVDSSREPSRW